MIYWTICNIVSTQPQVCISESCSCYARYCMYLHAYIHVCSYIPTYVFTQLLNFFFSNFISFKQFIQYVSSYNRKVLKSLSNLLLLLLFKFVHASANIECIIWFVVVVAVALCQNVGVGRGCWFLICCMLWALDLNEFCFCFSIFTEKKSLKFTANARANRFFNYKKLFGFF